MADNPRIQELERRVARDPASIAFAQLAEEYRRAGRLDDAVRVSRAGLERYPAYVSARVTLGRALLELEQYDDAYHELGAAVHVAPDNLAAIRALAELHQRRRQSSSARGALEADAPAAEPDGPASEPEVRAAGADMSEGTGAAADVEVQPSAPEPVEVPVESTWEQPPAATGAPAVDFYDERPEDETETVVDLSFVETFELVNDEGPDLLEGNDVLDGGSSFEAGAGAHAVEELLTHAEAPIEEPPAESAPEPGQAPQPWEGPESHQPENHDEHVAVDDQAEAAEHVAQQPMALTPDPPEPGVDPALPVLEAWLSALLADRARRHASATR